MKNLNVIVESPQIPIHGATPHELDQANAKLCSENAALAARLESALSMETLYKADLFDYLCWLEEKEQRERVPDAQFLCLASDGTTCWGKTYGEAVKVAMHHDKGLQDAIPPND